MTDVYATHTALHAVLLVGGLLAGFLVGMRASCAWWKRHIQSGFHMLGHIANRRGEIAPQDLAVAFDPKLREHKESYLARADDDPPSDGEEA